MGHVVFALVTAVVNLLMFWAVMVLSRKTGWNMAVTAFARWAVDSDDLTCQKVIHAAIHDVEKSHCEREAHE